MKLKNLFPITAILMVVLLGACQKNTNSILSSEEATKKPPSTGGQNLSPVNLGLAGSFTILSKSGITDVYASAVNGDVGTSPITGAAIHLTCAEVTGTIYTVNAAGPLPCRVINASRLTTAVGDMQTAYTDAAGRPTSTATTTQSYLNVGAGTLSGLTFKPGVYTWGTAVTITGDITLSGSSTDVWIFQIAGTLTTSSKKNIILSGGAKATNIFWQVAGAATLGTSSHFEGIILGQTGITLNTSASINGRLLAQTAVALQMATVIHP